MKRILLLSFLIVSIMLCGCSTSDGTKIINNQFVVISKDFNFDDGRLYITYDKDTRVMYYVVHCAYKYSICPIYNTDGTIKVYEE